ncbi:hypothetical protein EDB95_1519 [Dinghuibacter silviterrae]|uniref:NVEALA protein n=1 Tax=Dinghuibacter silviterrae TaxID=1539049 RepID=A0A4R8DQR2_9BACT|nr:hypothetical protein EDB95_1519 [Dinghuibacter silviterrae]
MKRRFLKVFQVGVATLAIASLLFVNITVSTNTTLQISVNKAHAEAMNCYGEVVGCTMPDGSAGTKSVCITTGTSTVKCVCGSANDCSKSSGGS